MAQFEQAHQKVIENEGRYVKDPDDPGGETYCGISRKNWSKWGGWITIDIAKTKSGFPNNFNLDNEVAEFYRVNFWDKIQGDKIESQEVAESIYDFAVNSGISVSVGLAQMVVGAKADGVIGAKSIEAINQFDIKHFLAAFTVAKIARYAGLVKKNPVLKKYFYGWVLRSLEG